MPKKPKLRVDGLADRIAALLPMDTSLFAPGDRVCVAVSGGADSTALLRTLLAQRDELGIVLSVLHVEHGLRGQASIDDAAFVRELAERFGLPCDVVPVDVHRRMIEHKESVETAARSLRYQAFRRVLAAGKVDKVATAHILDDQAETVLMKLLRGAWTEGLSGIHPELRLEDETGKLTDHSPRKNKSCVRPFLKVQRAQIEAYLRSIDQPWRHDASNDSLQHTRNRIRHELLPRLREFNPQMDFVLAHLADNARAEEQHWQTEIDRLLPLLILPGRPTRGGGRSVSTVVGPDEFAMEMARLRALDLGLLRRVLRAAAGRAGATLDFDATERLLRLVTPTANDSGKGARLELPGGAGVERSARELRFSRSLARSSSEAPSYELPVPGSVDAPAFHSSFRAQWPPGGHGSEPPVGHREIAQVRAWKPGDRVELQYSRGPKKVKEILARMRISPEDRATWPVVEWQGRIIWMRGVVLVSGKNRDQSPGNSCPIPVVTETPR